MWVDVENINKKLYGIIFGIFPCFEDLLSCIRCSTLLAVFCVYLFEAVIVDYGFSHNVNGYWYFGGHGYIIPGEFLDLSTIIWFVLYGLKFYFLSPVGFGAHGSRPRVLAPRWGLLLAHSWKNPQYSYGRSEFVCPAYEYDKRESLPLFFGVCSSSTNTYCISTHHTYVSLEAQWVGAGCR